MTADLSSLANRLVKGRELSIEEYAFFIENRTPELAQELAWQAVEVRQGIYGKDVYVRGLIEISNI